MGSTVFRYIPKGRNGKIFFESFEYDNWLTAQGWATLRGTPVNTSTRYKYGTHSFAMDSSFPLIEKDLSAIANPAGNFYGKVWFYDVATSTATAPTFAWVLDNLGNKYGIGINDAVAPSGTYKYDNNGSQSNTTTTRTTGWHVISFKYTAATLQLVIQIDGSAFLTITLAAGSWIKKVRLGTTASSGTVPFGNFDWVQVGADQYVTLYGLSSGQKAYLVTDLNNPYGAPSSGTATGTPPLQLDLSAALTFDCPLTGYLLITGTDGILPYAISDQLSIFFGDIYTVGSFDFGRRAQTFEKGRAPNRTTNVSTSGIEENILFNSREPVGFSIPDITEDQRRDLITWYSMAQAGAITSAALDSGELFYAPLSNASVAGASTIRFNTFYTRWIRKGTRLLILAASGLNYEEVQVSTVSGTEAAPGNTVTLTGRLLQSYAAGTFVRSANYWPKLINTDQKFPASLSQPKIKRWNFSPSFKEAF